MSGVEDTFAAFAFLGVLATCVSAVVCFACLGLPTGV